MSPILDKLRPYQQEHFQFLANILRNWFCALDSSGTGRGKTYVTVALAAFFGLKIFLVCVGSVVEKWKRVAEEFGVELVHVTTYDSLRGTQSSKTGETTLTHQYLKRIDATQRKENEFEATQKLKDLLKNEGILCVFDESHKTKNDTSLCFRASHAVVKAVVQADSQSRAILLSATPFDRKESVFTILCMLGIIKANNFFEISRGRRAEMTGFKELRDWCEEMDPEEIERQKLSKGVRINKNSVTDIALNLYQDIVKPRLVNAMQVEMPFPPEIKNAYFPLPNDQLDRLNELLNRLRRLRMNISNTPGENKRKQGAFGEINPIMQEIQQLKTQITIDFAASILDKVPHSKVVIYADYVKTHEALVNGLSSYGSILVNGSVNPIEKRNKLFASFQEPSDEVRVGVFHPAVGGIGLDLDDKDGNYPRYFLIMPGFNFINIHQSVGRGSRESTKSKPHVMFIYISGAKEIRVLNSLRSKGKTASEAVSMKQEVYPSEYGEVVYSTPNLNAIIDQTLVGDSAPTGANSTPSGANSTPSGANSTPSGANSTPTNQTSIGTSGLTSPIDIPTKSIVDETVLPDNSPTKTSDYDSLTTSRDSNSGNKEADFLETELPSKSLTVGDLGEESNISDLE